MTTNPVEMITAFGHEVWFDKPHLTTIDPRDLKQHTSNICRYNGALEWHLIRHLLLVRDLVMINWDEPGITFEDQVIQAAYGCAHDLHESYCTDVVSGLKKQIPAYRVIEDAWECRVHQEIGLPIEYRNAAVVKHADQRALVCEMHILNHAGFEVVEELFGGPPSEAETKAFLVAQSTSKEAIWKKVWSTILLGKRLLKAKLEKEEEIYDNETNGAP